MRVDGVREVDTGCELYPECQPAGSRASPTSSSAYCANSIVRGMRDASGIGDVSDMAYEAPQRMADRRRL